MKDIGSRFLNKQTLIEGSPGNHERPKGGPTPSASLGVLVLRTIPRPGFRSSRRTRRPLSATALAMLLFVHYGNVPPPGRLTVVQENRFLFDETP